MRSLAWSRTRALSWTLLGTLSWALTQAVAQAVARASMRAMVGAGVLLRPRSNTSLCLNGAERQSKESHHVLTHSWRSEDEHLPCRPNLRVVPSAGGASLAPQLAPLLTGVAGGCIEVNVELSWCDDGSTPRRTKRRGAIDAIQQALWQRPRLEHVPEWLHGIALLARRKELLHRNGRHANGSHFPPE